MTENNPTPTTNNKTVIYVVIAVIAVLIIGGIAYAVSENNRKSESDKKSSSSSSEMMKSKEAKTSIVDTVTTNSNFTTLKAAVTAAELESVLQGPGPFTVFAPTNNAFTKLPAGTLNNLLKPENKQDLTDILKYHVVSGKFMTSDLKDGQEITALSGAKLKVTKSNGKTMINDAVVETADLAQTNGVVHVIDGVLLPLSATATQPNIVDVAINTPNFSTLVQAVTAANLVNTFQGTGPYTVFAPTNEAFTKLPAGTVENLLKPENKTQLTNTLTYHVVNSKFMAKDLKNGQEITTLGGGKLTVVINGTQVSLKDSTGAMIMITSADVPASNGVIHAINGVLTPAAR